MKNYIRLWGNTEIREKFNVLMELLVTVIGWAMLGFLAILVWATIVVF